MVRNRHNQVSKTLKDYAVAIIAGILIIILAYSLFIGDNSNTNPIVTSENSSGLEITFGTDDTEAYVVFSGGDKKQIEDNKILYKGEKLLVKNGALNISIPSVGEFRLDKLGELEYRQDGTFYLNSSNLWVKAEKPLKLSLKYADVLIGEKSVVNLNQNEVESSVYNMEGMVTVNNLSGQETVLGKLQRISISVQDASSSEVDLSTLKQDLDDFFKSSDWFIKNKGEEYLKNNSSSDLTTKSLSGVTNTGSVSIVPSPLLTFDNLTDESYISSNSINITGTYKPDSVGKIVINGTEAKLSSDIGTFKLDNLSLTSNVNDVVVKIYDTGDNILKKIIYTVYVSGVVGKEADSQDNHGFTVKNFPIDASKFIFTAPSTTGTYTTHETRVDIKGSVPVGLVSKITINDYILGSFKGTTWRYHAWVDYNNLKDGANIYEVKYFDNSGKMIYTNNFTIIKKSGQDVKNSNTKDTSNIEVKAKSSTNNNSSGSVKQ